MSSPLFLLKLLSSTATKRVRWWHCNGGRYNLLALFDHAFGLKGQFALPVTPPGVKAFVSARHPIVLAGLEMDACTRLCPYVSGRLVLRAAASLANPSRSEGEGGRRTAVPCLGRRNPLVSWAIFTACPRVVVPNEFREHSPLVLSDGPHSASHLQSDAGFA